MTAVKYGKYNIVLTVHNLKGTHFFEQSTGSDRLEICLTLRFFRYLFSNYITLKRALLRSRLKNPSNKDQNLPGPLWVAVLISRWLKVGWQGFWKNY